jgi:hypothetical protein
MASGELTMSLWSMRSVHLMTLMTILVCPHIASAGIITITDRLPPFEGAYAGRGLHALFEFLSPAIVVEIRDPTHTPDPLSVVCFDPENPDEEVTCRGAMEFVMPGDGEIEEFSSNVSLVGCAFTPGGTVCEAFEGTGIVAKTLITLTSPMGGARLFSTELLELTIGGMLIGESFTLREDPDRGSTGETRVEDIGGGRFRIDSFFDVFMELSLADSPFVDCDPCGRVTLVVPEPANVLLLGPAFGSWVWWRRRRSASVAPARQRRTPKMLVDGIRGRGGRR